MSSLTNIISVILLAVAAYYMGYMQHRIYEKFKEIEEKLTTAQTKPGVTLGSYASPETKRKPTVHVVSSKTPQRIAYEAEMQQLDEARKGKFDVRPR